MSNVTTTATTTTTSTTSWADIGTILNYVNPIEEFLSGDYDSNNKTMKHFSDLIEKLTESIKPRGVSSDYSVANWIQFGHLLYHALVENKINPWLLDLSNEKYLNLDPIKKLADYLALSEKYSSLYKKIDMHDRFKTNNNASDDYVPEYDAKSPCCKKASSCKSNNNLNSKRTDDEDIGPKLAISFIDELVSNIAGYCKDTETVKEITNETGIDPFVILDNLDKITDSIENGDFKVVRKLLTSLATDLKKSSSDLIDAIKDRILDCINESSAETDKEKVENILKDRGFEIRYDDDGTSKAVGLTRFAAIKDNLELEFILDIDGIFANPIPKIFIINNKKISFGIKIPMFEKYLDEIEKGMAIDDIMTNKKIEKVVVPQYINLNTVYGINLADKSLIKEYRKLYSLVRSPEWKGYVTATNSAANGSPEKTLTATVNNDKIDITRSDGQLLFTIETIGNKDVVKAAPSTNGVANPIVVNKPIDADSMMSMFIMDETK